MNWGAHLLGWRELLLSLILLIVSYMVWLIWRMRRLSRARFLPREEEKPAAPQPVKSRSDAPPRNEPVLHAAPTLTGFDSALSQSLDARKQKDEALTYSRPASAAPDHERETPRMAERQTRLDHLTMELADSREEIETLRGALSAVREEMDTLRSAFAKAIQDARAAQNTSPLYSEAMQMAILGHDALTIAERCGISRAEADLVVSLVKNKEGHSL
ncbi:MAG: DUF2802 domain-containing protein [Zoogloeaceae bacterium]|jgi:predicted RNase H-like nuclease (RuvC/YqgF family)|nr:DUF2802 domain-containing protein [Zoogloeaceae bacterium]